MPRVTVDSNSPRVDETDSNRLADRCVSCGSRNIQLIGRIPSSNCFAGRTLDRILPGGLLWNCADCHLQFRYPRPEKSTLDELYRGGSHESWSAPADVRTDWKLISAFLASTSTISSVLDVGCFDGRFLEFLGPDYRWFGVEINETAAQRAEAKGVRVLSPDFEAIGSLSIAVDAVVAIDVIEHSEDPRLFLGKLARSVRSGGIVIVSSGSTDALGKR